MKKYTLAILAIFKNEEMVIKEWLDHYIWQGVEHFYLIDNDSNDNYLEIIQPYLDSGLITLYNLPEKYKQIKHYNTIFNQIKTEMEWLAIIDIDEYLFHTETTLFNFIKKIPDEYNRIRTFWYFFGSSGCINHPNSIRESFLYRWNNNNTRRTGLSKCIIKVDDVYKLDVHNHFNINSKIIEDSINGWNTLIDNNLILNHYVIMSKEYYEKVKLTRGDVLSNGLKYEQKRNWGYFNYINYNSTLLDERLCNLLKNGYK